ncbi:DUF2878 family protein [Ferrimonas lipolytica]|uniref:DUF2878 domain-containing protein n=1 Tax=Ferrimonas lipolytica TaxID=2724191 RepID=A0A6H1UCS9_9GAMM|nr:DUF2878 family protein [Ferrimonas lipolytica]QIZ76844.1 DUF2878 domain-containing protein [Ferrimonas lipolytica]
MSRTDLITIALFKLSWLVAIFGQQAWLWLQLIIVTIAVVTTPIRLALPVILFATAGVILDSVLHYTGVLSFVPSTDFIPLYLALLWLSFSILIIKMKSSLPTKKLTLSVLFGVAGASGYSAATLAGTTVLSPNFTIAAIIIVFAWMTWITAAYHWLEDKI